MRPEQNQAMLMYMKTESGRAYMQQFLKDGETVSFKGYTVTGAGNGKYANSRLVFGAMNLSETTNGQSMGLHSDGTKLLSGRKSMSDYKNNGDLGKLQKNQSFEMRVALNANKERTAEEWAETLGHEVFVHSTDDAAVIQEVVDMLKNGVTEADLDKIAKMLNTAGTSAESDHSKLNAGKDQDYNQYMKELEENKKDEEEE